MTKDKTILKAHSLSKRFGNIIAVDDISFEIYRGEVFGFLGPNGAGKTTSIKMMTGLLKPDKGSVKIDCEKNGKSVGLLSVKEAGRKGEELLHSLGLYGIKDRLGKNLSGGMQRRLNIALALIHSPEILFLDEPQAGLDPQSRILVRDYIRSIKSKTTVVLTTHDMEEAEKLSDRICIIDKGKLLVSGTANQIKMTSGFGDLIVVDINSSVHDRFLSFLDPGLITNMTRSGDTLAFGIKDPIPALKNILDVLGEQNLKVDNLRLRKSSLEDIFINLTGRSLRE